MMGVCVEIGDDISRQEAIWLGVGIWLLYHQFILKDSALETKGSTPSVLIIPLGGGGKLIVSCIATQGTKFPGHELGGWANKAMT